MNWADANAWVANLSFTDGIHVYDNWRLPDVAPVDGISYNVQTSFDGSTDRGFNISKLGTVYAGSTASEMAHMFYVTLSNPGGYIPSSSGDLVLSGCQVSDSDTCLDNVGPFSNLQPWLYWSASEAPSYQPSSTQGISLAWGFRMDNGGQAQFDITANYYAWAVSSGDVAAIPEPETCALMLTGLGLVGFVARRRKLANV